MTAANPTASISTSFGNTRTGPDIRFRAIAFCFVVGLGTPALCWGLALLGYQSADLRLDRVATLAVCLSVYAPALAFLNNPGERRALNVQLFHFGWLFFCANVGYQVFWEMPWFILKDWTTSGTITDADTLFWPWWAYGVADTRYLNKSDIPLAISAMDGSVALLEVVLVVLFYKGYRLFVSWMALILGACMCWGQYYFYITEVYSNFAMIQDGWFGLYIKYIGMGLAWLFYPMIAGVGMIWYIATVYKKRAIADYVKAQQQTPTFGKSFASESNILMTTDLAGDEIPETSNHGKIRKLVIFALAWPFLFLLVDITLYYARHYW